MEKEEQTLEYVKVPIIAPAGATLLVSANVAKVEICKAGYILAECQLTDVEHQFLGKCKKINYDGDTKGCVALLWYDPENSIPSLTIVEQPTGQPPPQSQPQLQQASEQQPQVLLRGTQFLE